MESKVSVGLAAKGEGLLKEIFVVGDALIYFFPLCKEYNLEFTKITLIERFSYMNGGDI